MHTKRASIKLPSSGYLQKLGRLITLSLLLGLLIVPVACNQEVPTIKSELFAFHREHGFHDIRHMIVTRDGAYVAVGIAENQPAILVLNKDFSLRFFKQFNTYGKGGFQQVVERANGELAMVGYVLSPQYGGGPTDGTSVMLRMSADGQFISHDFRVSPGFEQFSVIHEDPDGQLIAGGYSGAHTFFQRFGDQAADMDTLTWPTGYMTPRSIATTADEDYLVLAFKAFVPNAVNSFKANTFIIDKASFSLGGRQSERVWSTHFASNTNGDDLYGEAPPLFGTVHMASEQSAVMAMKYLDPELRRAFRLTQFSIADKSVEWDQLHYGDGQAEYRDMIRYKDGYLLLGSTIDTGTAWNTGADKGYVLAVDEEGNERWHHSISGRGSDVIALKAVVDEDMIHVCGYLSRNGRQTLLNYTLDMDGKLVDARP